MCVCVCVCLLCVCVCVCVCVFVLYCWFLFPFLLFLFFFFGGGWGGGGGGGVGIGSSFFFFLFFFEPQLHADLWFHLFYFLPFFIFFLSWFIGLLHWFVCECVCVCVCVRGGGGGGVPGWLPRRTCEMRHDVESIHNHMHLQSFYNNQRDKTYRWRQRQQSISSPYHTVHLQMCSTFASSNTLCLTNSKTVSSLVFCFCFFLVFSSLLFI